MSEAGAVASEKVDLPDGRRIGFREYGSGNGLPVLYCHGLPGSRLEAGLLHDAAQRHGLRVLGIDRPGYGETSPMPGRRVGEEISDVRAIVDHLALDRFDAIGFSGGGPHAMAIAAGLPERVGSLTLVSSWSPFDAVGLGDMDPGYRQLWKLAQDDFASFRTALSRAIDEAGDPYTLLLNGAPETDREILSMPTVGDRYRENAREATRSGHGGMFEDAGAVIGEWSFSVSSVECPAHVWHGELDGNAPVSMGQWLARHLPDARYTQWPGAAHFEWLRHTDEIVEPHTGN